MPKKGKGHSKKKRHPGVGVRYKPQARSAIYVGTTKERKMARKGPVKSEQAKYVMLVSSNGKVRNVREDSL